MTNHRTVLLFALALTGCPSAPRGPDVCAEPTGAGVTHSDTITADETWRAEDGPHLVPSGVAVRATVTIEPCAVVRVGEGASITIGDSVTAGRVVARGQVIGWVGQSGASTGPHLHFEMRLRGERVDPLRYLVTGSILL